MKKLSEEKLQELSYELISKLERINGDDALRILTALISACVESIPNNQWGTQYKKACVENICNILYNLLKGETVQ